MPDYYRILGISERATRRQIQRAYRVLAKRYHPDRLQSASGGASAAVFREITTAYHVLSHPDLRKAYDARHASDQSEPDRHYPETMNNAFSNQPFTVWQGPSVPMTPYRSLNIFLGGVKLLLMVILMIAPFLVPFVLLFFYFRLFRP